MTTFNRDDADEEDEDEEDEDEEEEHLAPADSAVVVPTVELVSLPEGTKPVIPPPSTDITTTGARITVRLQASISLPPEAKVERLLAMPTPPPSPPISLSPPSAGECLARCTTPSTHSSPPPVPSPSLPPSGCPTQIQTLRIASTQALIDAVTAALPSPPLPPLPPSYTSHLLLIVLLQTHQSRGIDYGFVSTLDAEERQQGIKEVRTEALSVWWIKKMELVFNISGCAIENQVKFATYTMLGAALTWWNGQIRTLGPEAYSITWEVLKKKMTDKYCPQAKTLDETIELANDLMDQKLPTSVERQSDNKRKADDSSRNNHGKKKPYGGSFPKSSGNTNVTNTQKGNGVNPKGNGCFECGALGHFKRDCPKLKNKDGGNGSAQGWVYAVGNAVRKGNVSRDPNSNVVTGMFLLNNSYASILFDTGADRSFISTAFSSLIDIAPTLLENSYDVELADGKIVRVNTIM
ncbi:putative reverse transcriptase domain-containing protein [Tanacetum coccineum]